MPSASSKLEKPASTDVEDPLKQAIVLMGHKIRNLEKRKSRLDSYKESIQTLSKEQVEAISKYDEVVLHLELSKEYLKQFTVISVENEKAKKKQAKKDAQEKYIADVNRIKQVLIIQDVLQHMGANTARNDFLAGQNGAIQLTEHDLKTLEDLYIEVTPKRVVDDGTSSSNPDSFQKPAEYLLAIADGKAKEIAGSTGAKLRELVNSINSCGYFNQQRVEEGSRTEKPAKPENEKPAREHEFHERKEISSTVILPTQNSHESKGCNMPNVPNAAPVQPIIPGPPMIPAGVQSAMMQTNQPPILMPNVASIVPTPVSQVESSFFNAQGFKPPIPPSVIPPPTQNTRQINDVIQSVAGKFSFLQESEIDLTEMNSGMVTGNASIQTPQIPGIPPSAIPTQTFTNQNFNGQTGGAPAYPPNYPPQPAAFQTFVPAFPAFVPPNASTVPNINPNSNSVNCPAPLPINSTTIPNSNCNISNDNKCNNIPNPIPMAPNRNPNVNFNQGISISQQQMASSLQVQGNPQNLSQPPSLPVYQHGNMSVGTMENVKIEDAVRKDSEMKEKQELEKRDWTQPERTNWADDWNETTEWNPPSQTQSDGRPHRNGSGVLRNSNGFQGSRNRPNRQGGYRDSQSNQGPHNYYQNQNGYRHERNNDYSMTGKMNSDLRENTFKERGDFGNRDRDNYVGGFKRGPSNRGPNMKGSMDRGDRQAPPLSRNNMNGPRGPRNLNRQPGGRNGPPFQRQPTHSGRPDHE